MAALFYAVDSGDLERVKVLVEGGDNKNMTDPGGQTPLFAASHYGHLSVVRYLAEQGVDMNKANDVGHTPHTSIYLRQLGYR